MTLTELPALSLFCILDVCSDTESVGARPFDRTSIWFPVPATVKTLPDTPTPEVRPYVKPANSVEVGPCFDPDNVDVDQLFNSLLPRREISPVFDVSLNVDRLLLPKNQRVTIRGRLRAVFTVLRARYDLTPKLVEISSVTSTPVSVYRLKAKLTGLGTSFVLSTTEAYFRKQSPILGLPASYHLNFPATALVYGEAFARTLSAEPGEFTLNPSTRILLLSHFDTTFDEVTGNTPGYNWFNSLPPVISSNGVFNSPGCLEFNGSLQYLFTYITPTLFPEEIPTWTAECWVYVPLGEFSMVPMCFSADGHPDNTAFYVGIETGNLGAIEVYVGVKNTNQNFTGIFRAIVPYDFTESWTHLVWQATSNGYQLYFGGQLLSDRDTNSTIIPFVLPEYSIYNPINVRSGFVLGTSLWYVGDDYYFTYPGKIDEVRLTESTLYYGVSFTPPTAPFTAEPIEPANAQLTLGKLMVLDSGIFTCQGQDAVFTKPSKVFKGLAASYTLTGGDITTKLLDRVLVASPRSFSVTGNQTIDIPTYVGVTGSVVGTVEASLPWPSGHRAGDLGIIITESSRANPGSRPITPPYGWSMLPGWPNFDPGSYCTVFYKIARSGSEPDAVFPVFTDHMILQMSVFRGVDAAQPFVTVASGANSSVTTAIQYPAVSGVIPRTRIVEFTTNPRDSTSIDGATNRQNTSAAWVDAGAIGNINTSNGDGGGISTYNATTLVQLNNGLPGTTASSLNGWASTRTTGTLVLRPIGWAPIVVPVLSAEAGVFTVAGEAVGLISSRVFAAVAGNYNLTGIDAYLGRPPIILPATEGAYTLTGQAAGVIYSRGIAAAAGGFTAAGQEALLGEPDAVAYVAAVQVADNQALEPEVANAYSKFIWGCKSDGIWSAIKASCIMAGARTLAGALTPLKGTAPTNYNFVAGDYNRTTGLVGDGSTKFLNSNRANNADPQNSNHNAVYASLIGAANAAFMGAEGTPGGGNTNALLGGQANNVFTRSRSATGIDSGSLPVAGFIGSSRAGSTSYVVRNGGSNSTASTTSGAPEASNVYIFRRVNSTSPNYSSHRLSFYSIGESLDLALLDSRVSTLMADIAAAIP